MLIFPICIESCYIYRGLYASYSGQPRCYAVAAPSHWHLAIPIHLPCFQGVIIVGNNLFFTTSMGSRLDFKRLKDTFMSWWIGRAGLIDILLNTRSRFLFLLMDGGSMLLTIRIVLVPLIICIVSFKTTYIFFYIFCRRVYYTQGWYPEYLSRNIPWRTRKLSDNATPASKLSKLVRCLYERVRSSSISKYFGFVLNGKK